MFHVSQRLQPIKACKTVHFYWIDIRPLGCCGILNVVGGLNQNYRKKLRVETKLAAQ